MSTTSIIRQAVVAALTGTTDAGNNVFFARTWPTQPGSYPVLLVPPLDETGQSWGNSGAPAFNVTVTLRVFARFQENGSEPGSTPDAGSAAAAIALERLRDQVKAAIINNPALMGFAGPIQQFSAFRCHTTQIAEGEEPLAQMAIEIDMETVQGPDDFYQPVTVPLEGIDVTVRQPDGTTQPGLTINLPQ
ncbi:hypothetical protein AB3X91_09070 [Paraburkholderia sp. BR14263]|uniref:hypothetical protein n=1 Tax=unclassified Paraburkholderia TaxID=2615204 RepID=UPI0034CD926B